MLQPHSFSPCPNPVRQKDGKTVNAMQAANTDSPLLRAQYADLKTWLAGGILTKVDRASMAASLEVRAPLLDYQLAEWALNLAPSLKLNGNTGKFILKRALEPYVSEQILYRPKQGFSMRALASTQNNVSQASKLLGVSRPTLYELMKSLGIKA